MSFAAPIHLHDRIFSALPAFVLPKAPTLALPLLSPESVDVATGAMLVKILIH